MYQKLIQNERGSTTHSLTNDLATFGCGRNASASSVCDLCLCYEVDLCKPSLWHTHTHSTNRPTSAVTFLGSVPETIKAYLGQTIKTGILPHPMGGHTGERAHSGFCFHVTKLLRAPGVYPEQLCQHLLCRAGKIRVCQEVCDINWHQKITNIFVLQTHPGISTGDKVPELIVIATSARP